MLTPLRRSSSSPAIERAVIPPIGIQKTIAPTLTLKLCGFHLAGPLWSHDGQTGMYGPPLCRKRKTNVTGWSAQMYPAFVEHKLLALDGMRCALVLQAS